MAQLKWAPETPKEISREEWIEKLHDDLAREYQAIIGDVVYSQVLKGSEYVSIAGELEKHAEEQLNSNQIGYLGGMPAAQTKPVKTWKNANELLQFDLTSGSPRLLSALGSLESTYCSSAFYKGESQ